MSLTYKDSKCLLCGKEPVKFRKNRTAWSMWRPCVHNKPDGTPCPNGRYKEPKKK